MSRRNWGVLVMMLLIGVGIFVYALRDINLHVLIQEFNTINWGWMLVAVICICLYLGLRELW